MKMLRFALLYTALALIANPASAMDAAALEPLREGTMRKLNFSEAPVSLPEIALERREGGMVTLNDYAGRIVVLNFWATWCAPCREEMPSLAELNRTFGGEDFAVVTVAAGPNPPQALERFLTEYGVSDLPVLLDPRMELSREVGVLGLPVTLILDRDGTEAARLIGDADWASPSAKAIVAAILAE